MICPALQTLPNGHAGTLSNSRHVQVSSRSVFASTSNLSRVQSRHCQSIRTCLNATDSSEQQQPHSPEQLAHELQDAVRKENYQKAAELRDVLKSLQPQDTVAALKKQMEQFVAEDKFEVSCVSFTQDHCVQANHACQFSPSHHLLFSQEAAAVRDQLRAVVQKNIEEAQKRTASDAVTEGVRVRVRRCLPIGTFIAQSIHPLCCFQHRQCYWGGCWCHTRFDMQLLRAESVISRSKAILLRILCHDQ